MSFLIITTIIWSLSFSLIGRNLSTYIDPWSLGLIRTALSVLLFLPFINFKIKLKRIFVYVSIGFVQLGMMYFFYLNAFTYTSIPKIMLFTIFTPLYVTLFSSLIYKEFQKSFFLATFLAIFGGLILRYTIINSTDLTGFILIQLSNICFATGQVFYQYYFKLKKTNKYNIDEFGYFFIGAFISFLIGFFIFGNNLELPSNGIQWLTILWLSFVASGIGYYLWNLGSLKVNSGTLAVMNNLIIPLGLLIELLFYKQQIDIQTLILGFLIISGSIYLTRK